MFQMWSYRGCTSQTPQVLPNGLLASPRGLRHLQIKVGVSPRTSLAHGACVCVLDWTMHFSSVTNLHVHNNNVTNPDEPNADGIDIDSTQDALIEDNFFDVPTARQKCCDQTRGLTQNTVSC